MISRATMLSMRTTWRCVASSAAPSSVLESELSEDAKNTDEQLGDCVAVEAPTWQQIEDEKTDDAEEAEMKASLVEEALLLPPGSWRLKTYRFPAEGSMAKLCRQLRGATTLKYEEQGLWRVCTARAILGAGTSVIDAKGNLPSLYETLVGHGLQSDKKIAIAILRHIVNTMQDNELDHIAYNTPGWMDKQTTEKKAKVKGWGQKERSGRF